MGIKWTDLSEAQRALINDPTMPLQTPQMTQEGFLTPPKGNRAARSEKREQSLFANDCLRKGLPFCWHATNSRSKATPGTPDFWCGKDGKGYWIEFKAAGGKLSPEQELFKEKLQAQSLQLHVVYSAAEAIKLINL